MNKIDIIRQAIRERQPIEFESKEGSGQRIGNPQVLYVFRSKAGAESTKVDIEQTAGVSSSKKPFPSFRTFDFEELVIISVLESKGPFAPSVDYEPTSDRYEFAIEKV